MNQEKIGKFIAKMRKEKNLTQEDLAEILNVNSRSISRWENGKCLPDISMYNSICEVLDISVNELLSGEKVEPEKYQDKFEKNIIEVVGDIDIKSKGLRKINLVILFILVFISSFILFIYLCDNVYLKMDYDNNFVTFSNENDKYELKTPRSGEIKYVYFEYENECLVFATYYDYLGNIIGNQMNFSEFIGYNLTDVSTSRELFLSDSCLNKAKKIYYTKENFSTINKTYRTNDLKKLDRIVDKSKLLYQSKK